MGAAARIAKLEAVVASLVHQVEVLSPVVHQVKALSHELQSLRTKVEARNTPATQRAGGAGNASIKVRASGEAKRMHTHIIHAGGQHEATDTRRLTETPAYLAVPSWVIHEFPDDTCPNWDVNAN